MPLTTLTSFPFDQHASPSRRSRPNPLECAWEQYVETMEGGAVFLKQICGAVNVTSFWTQQIKPDMGPSLKKIGGFAKDAGKALGALDTANRVSGFMKSLTNYDPNNFLKSTSDVLDKGCGVVKCGCDTAELVNSTVTPLPTDVMERVKLVGASAGLFSSLKGVYDSGMKLMSNFADLDKLNQVRGTLSPSVYDEKKINAGEKITSTLLAVAAKVSAAVLGVLSVLAFYIQIDPIAIITVATITTLVGLISYLFDKVVDPYDAGANRIRNHRLFERAQCLAIKKD
ncbi:MAG: hypothetical protein EBZ47_00835 [Chlamydiae bacterium]|nr:hypothetical protein [Chlamydiota bacterium]